MYACMYAQINKTNESIFVVCVYMVSKMTSLHRTTNTGAHPWGRLILLFPEVNKWNAFHLSTTIG